MHLLLLILLTAAGALAPQGEMVLQKEGDKQYHRPGCPVVREPKGVLALSRAQAESRGLVPHDGCDPSKASPDGKAAEEPVFVFLDDSKYYHREDCKKMKGKPRRESLEIGAKKRWPCPVCKPPIRKRR
jgi:hypothetical protein